MIRISRFEAVEIPVPSGSTLTRFYFPDLPNLRNAKITSIQVYTAGTITATPLTGSTPVTTADLKKSYLTLYSGDLQLVYNVPMLTFNNIANSATDPYVFELPVVNGITISWVKSYVVLPTALATTGVAYSFGVYYEF
ncbi:MAG: hypothetical protein ACOVOQ_00640 [Flavobacterium sp.]|jgi:hypothetical protein